MGQEMMDINSYYSQCKLCPNECGVDRTKGQTGVCGQSNEMQIAWVGLHRGEEPPITGEHGSGMVFFCGCPLRCQYCQNYQISHAFKASCAKSAGGKESYEGVTVSIEELAALMLKLQEFGAASINLVTGTHYIPSIVQALEISKNNGLKLPIVWNSSGYESVQALKLIDPYLDLYLLDCKTLDPQVASKFCGRACYSSAIVPVMKFLKRRYPTTNMENGLTGVLVRHLVFPGTLEATMSFLSWYADNFKDNFLLSLMTQFVPPLNDPGFPKISAKEYGQLMEALDRYDLDGFAQEMEENEILWIPDFTKDQPFPAGFADPLPAFLEIKNRV